MPSIAVTYTFIVDVPEDYDYDDVVDAANEYVYQNKHSLGSPDNIEEV